MNSMIIAEQDSLTMSSKEISEILSTRHDSVKRTILSLTDKNLITFTQSVEPTLGGGKPTHVFSVNKRDSYIVVAQLSPEFTVALVDRWQELEDHKELPYRLPDYTLKIKELQEKLNSLVKKQSLVEQLKIMEGHEIETVEMSDSTYVFDAYTEQYMKDKVTINWKKINHSTLGRNIIRVINNPFTPHKGRGVPLNLAKASIARVIKKHTK